LNNRYSLHKITDENDLTFDPIGYSWFKFGDRHFANQFGADLFNGFIHENGERLLLQDEIVVLPSPFLAIPTASNFLCFAFVRELNKFLFENGKRAAIESKIYRNQTYVADYGSLGFEERVRLISNDTYYIDREFINGRFCLFLDDIKITGSHELTIMKILDEYDVKGDFNFVYFAELMNKEIHPRIENHFNYYAVKGIDEILDLIKRPSFQFNTRVTKYILNLPTETFQTFINQVETDRRKELFFAAISNNYHQIAEYKKNIIFTNIT
jgi:hypothetical protein